MKVFISWSGDRSMQVAELLNNWIQCVIQAIDPWISSKDIDRGALWFSEISDQLSNTSIGIVCLTKENKNKPWILFETGALAKGLASSRVCTFLIDLKPNDLQNPLAQFNHTLPEKDSMWNLVCTINSALKEKSLKKSILGDVFETYWEQFETKFNQIISTTPQKEVEEERNDTDILSEVLSTVRTFDRRLRNIERKSERILFEEEEREIPSISTRMEIRMTVQSMIEQNLPESIIKELLSNKGFPRFIIEQEINRAKRNIEKE